MLSQPFSTSTTRPSLVWDIEETSNHNHNHSNHTDNDDVTVTTESTAIVVKYVSDDALYVVVMVVMVTLSGLVSLLGIVSNVINMAVFVRQGVFSESSNVSLMSLSLADFLCVVSMFWTSITYAIALNKPPNIRWEPFHIFYISGAWPRVITGLITRVITAFVALERCVCVVFPFKVKSIFTPKSSFITMVCIFAYFLISYSPVYYYNQFRYIPDPVTNITHLVLITLPGFTRFDAVVSFINLFTITFGSVTIVLLCTMITVSRVKLSSAWRESVTAASSTPVSKPDDSVTKQQQTGKDGSTSVTSHPEKTKAGDESSSVSTPQPKKMSVAKMRKEKKLIRMITLISVIFLVCYIPNLVITIMYQINNQITTKGDYKNLAWLMFSFIFLSETVNSSINIIVYYRMSTRFKQECCKMFGLKEEDTK